MNITINNKTIDIDDDCVDMVLYFNKIGFTTKYCCSGHGRAVFSIMFADNVCDKQIEDFVMKFSSPHNHSPFKGKFNKWLRKMGGELKYNWVYECSHIVLAKIDYKLFSNTVEREI